MKRVQILFCLFMVHISIHAQLTKQEYYVQPEFATNAIHTRCFDHGFLLTTQSQDANLSRFVTFYKTDSAGSLQWTRRFLTPEFCSLSNVVQSPDSGYFFCLVPQGMPDRYYVVKLDASGNTVFSRSVYPASNYLLASGTDCYARADGNFYIAGNLNDQQGNMVYWHVFELSSTGSVVWSKCYNGGASKCLQRNMTICANGDIALVGFQRDTTTPQYGPVITRTDSAGNVLWSKLYLDSSRNTSGTIIFERDDRNLAVIVSSGNSTNNLNHTIYLLTDSAGNFSWAIEYSNDTANVFSPGVGICDSGFVVITGSSGTKGTIIRFDAAGSVHSSSQFIHQHPTSVQYGVNNDYTFSGIDASVNRAVIFSADSSLNSCDGYTFPLDTSHLAFTVMNVPSGMIVPLGDSAFILPDVIHTALSNKTCLSAIESTEPDVTIHIFPVPAMEQLTVVSSEELEAVELISLHGQIIQQVAVSSRNVTIATNGLAGGLYFLRVIDRKGVIYLRPVVIENR